ncbi:MAG TPA: hypothetical protein P5057_08075, partial [Acidobacteriota bacterium]|nr:hypothetical protein [Acidobacteriota bacterium]
VPRSVPTDWLSQVKIKFSLPARKPMRDANLLYNKCVAELREAVETFIDTCGAVAKPFIWCN